MNLKKIIALLILLVFFTETSLKAQLYPKISFDSLNLKGTILLFETYESTEMDCQTNNGKAIYCHKKDRLFNNNIKDLKEYQTYALTFLKAPYEMIKKSEVSKNIYEDTQIHRYVFQYKNTISKKGSSCFSNPGALLIKYYVWDRLQNETYELDIKYYGFVCDIDLVVIGINNALKEEAPKK